MTFKQTEVYSEEKIDCVFARSFLCNVASLAESPLHVNCLQIVRE